MYIVHGQFGVCYSENQLAEKLKRQRVLMNIVATLVLKKTQNKVGIPIYIHYEKLYPFLIDNMKKRENNFISPKYQNKAPPLDGST